MNHKIILLCSPGLSTTALYNYISRFYTIDKVITEQPMRGKALVKRRIKKLGFIKVAGQVAFALSVVPFLRASSKKRIHQIKQHYRLDETPIPVTKIEALDSVNEDRCIALLKQLSPTIILVNGTRIISKKVLDSVQAVFINMHTGITPKYRGVHGGYWAAVNNDLPNCGVTIHLVDKGIDTGSVLYQATIPVTRKDNFVTYPYLQYGEGIPLVKKVIDDITALQLVPANARTQESRLWSHPTIGQYLYYWIKKTFNRNTLPPA